MRLLISRRCNLRYGVIGDLSLQDGSEILSGYSVELPWRENERSMSCIPEGTYTATLHNSPKFGKTIWLRDVPGRSEILVHTANSMADLDGCIGPGTEYGWWDQRKELAVWNSKRTLGRIIDAISERDDRDLSVEIRWQNPEH